METIVVKLIDDYRVVLNKGQKDGLSEGDEFIIYELGEEITDPLTNESLGRIEIIKGKGKVTHLQERLATVTSTNRYTKKVRREGRPTFPYFAGGIVEIKDEDGIDIFENAKVGDKARPVKSFVGIKTELY